MPLAGGERLGRLGRRPMEGVDAEDEGACAVAAHAVRDGRASAQRVKHEIADGAAVAGSREAMRLAPIRERVRRRARPARHVVEDLDRGRKAGGRRHGAGSAAGGIDGVSAGLGMGGA